MSSKRTQMFNYGKFTTDQFIAALKKVVEDQDGDSEKISYEFLGFCEPILFENGVTLLDGLNRIPRPYRELMALYQAWGMVGSDGFECYIYNTNSKFDLEVDRGLKLVGQRNSCGAVSIARNEFLKSKKDLPEDIDDKLWDKFYVPLKGFEFEILGPILMKILNIA